MNKRVLDKPITGDYTGVPLERKAYELFSEMRADLIWVDAEHQRLTYDDRSVEINIPGFGGVRVDANPRLSAEDQYALAVELAYTLVRKTMELKHGGENAG